MPQYSRSPLAPPPYTTTAGPYCHVDCREKTAARPWQDPGSPLTCYPSCERRVITRVCTSSTSTPRRQSGSFTHVDVHPVDLELNFIGRKAKLVDSSLAGPELMPYMYCQRVLPSTQWLESTNFDWCLLNTAVMLVRPLFNTTILQYSQTFSRS